MDDFTDDFTLYLPSNVKGAEENFISHYVTNLAAPINLNPNATYEVGLRSCIYPTTALNVYDSSVAYFSFTLGFEIGVTVPVGFYGTMQSVIDAIADVLGTDAAYYKFRVEESTHRVILELKSGDGFTTPLIKFSHNLQALLGMPEIVNRDGFQAGKPYDLSGGIGSMYIYSNICRYSNVGGSTSPLLAVVPYSNTSITSFGEHMSYEPRKVLYHPLTTTTLNELRIDVRTKFGKHLPFASGEFMAILSIRRRGLRL